MLFSYSCLINAKETALTAYVNLQQYSSVFHFHINEHKNSDITYQEVQFHLVHSSLPLPNRDTKTGKREGMKERKKDGQKERMKENNKRKKEDKK